MLEHLIDRYMQMFGESFPTAEFMGNEDGLIEALEESIRSGKRYEPNYEDDLLY